VQANILAAVAAPEGVNQVYNVAVHARTSLNALFDLLTHALARQGVQYDKEAVYQDFRAGDVRHSQADISKARTLLGYSPTHTIAEGLEVAMPWYVKFLG
jgi:UDP-N-acetylglucosamine 4-epimerase